MDIADRAADLEQMERESGLYLAQKAAHAKVRQLEPRGACFFCDGKTEGLFCDVSCTQLWEREQAARQRNGRKED